MIKLPHRRKHFRNISNYTEIAPTTFTIGTSSAWTEVDVYTDHSIPKGAILEIYAGCQATNSYAGVRTEGGDDLDRQLLMDVGYGTDTLNLLRFITKVNSTSGKIDCYANSHTTVEFVIVGYWTGIDFTERFDGMEVLAAEVETWVDRNLNTLFTTPKDRVYDIMMTSSYTTEYEMGARAKVASPTLDRKRKLSRYGTLAGRYNGYNLFTKINSDGVFQLYHQNYSAICTSYSMGYFEAGVDYQELWQDLALAASGAWTDSDLSSYITNAKNVEINLMEAATDTTKEYVGARVNPASGDVSRYLYVTRVDYTIATALSGYSMNCNIDSANKIELYAGDSAEDRYKLAGYFK